MSSTEISGYTAASVGGVSNASSMKELYTTPSDVVRRT